MNMQKDYLKLIGSYDDIPWCVGYNRTYDRCVITDIDRFMGPTKR